MNKLIAMFGILALAACGGGGEEAGATFEDTTAVIPVTETAPVTTTPPVTDTMAPGATMPAGTDAMATDTGAAATGTTTTP